MSGWEKAVLGFSSFLALYALAAWNVAAYRRRRLRERQAGLGRQAWLDDPGTASPGEERGK